MLAALCSAPTFSQPIVYSPYFRDAANPDFQVAAKAGQYYWVYKETLRSHGSVSRAFEVYDSRMNAVQRLNDDVPPQTIRQWLIGSEKYFDKLMLIADSGQTKLVVRRRTADGATRYIDREVGRFAFLENPKGFLLLRSASGTRLRILAFQSPDEGERSLHSLLFDNTWNILGNNVWNDANIPQPCIQDDFTSSPLGIFDNEPAVLANNGEWLMAAPSRRSTAFSFLHFCADGAFSRHDLQLDPKLSMDDVALCLNDNSESTIAILSSLRQTTFKQLQIARYTFATARFDFDSTYYFNTLATGEWKNRSLIRERLIGVAGGGYLFCKEYGREVQVSSEDAWPTNQFLSDTENRAPLPLFAKDPFARAAGLQSFRSAYERGDLAIFYFPANAGDSAWKGVINAPQTTEMNDPSLSYLVMPSSGHLMFVYNETQGLDEYASTLVIDRQGKPAEGGLAFWKFDRSLNFQHAHRLNSGEVAVPYGDRPGFAIIRL